MNQKKFLICIVIAVLITIMFFTYKPIITWDTSHYLWLTNMLTENGDFSHWDNVRGISFPLIILISQIFMGINSNSLLVVMYICYMIMIFTCINIYIELKKNTILISEKMKYLIYILFFVMIVINPLILGYYHVLLTEFIGMTMALISCYFSWKFLDIDFYEEKIKYILCTIFFIVFSIFMWHIKQPYVSTVLFPLIISVICSIINNFKIKNIIQRITTVLFCILGVLLSIFIWNNILKSNNVNIAQERTSSGMISNQLLKGISFYEIKDKNIDEKYIQLNQHLTEKERHKLISLIDSKSKNYVIMEEKIDDEVKDTRVIFTKNENITTLESLKFILETVIKNPKILVKSYFLGYLAMSDILSVEFNNNTMNYNVKEILPIFELYENAAIGYKPYRYFETNSFVLPKEYEIYAIDYTEKNMPILPINWIMQRMQFISTTIYKISFVLCPLLLLINVLLIIIKKLKYNKLQKKLINFIIILLGFSFLHIVLHVVLGAIIDRYAMPATITTYIAIILEICLVSNIIGTKKLNESNEIEREGTKK